MTLPLNRIVCCVDEGMRGSFSKVNVEEVVCGDIDYDTLKNKCDSDFDVATKQMFGVDVGRMLYILRHTLNT